MQVVILAGGRGLRLIEMTQSIPKPMVNLGKIPIIRHIMNIYCRFGHNDFILCLGYLGGQIRNYFLDASNFSEDTIIEKVDKDIVVIKSPEIGYNITFVDTGLETLTAGRLKRVESYISEDLFFMTYGDGLADLDIDLLIQNHRKSGKIATVTAVYPEERFGRVEINNNNEVTALQKKPRDDNFLINGGYFVLHKRVFNYLSHDADYVMWEEEPIQQLIKDNQLNAYRHLGDWKCMDVLRDKIELDNLIQQNKAFWIK